MTASTGSPGSGRGFAVTTIAACSGWSARDNSIGAETDSVGAVDWGNSNWADWAAETSGAGFALAAPDGGVLVASAGAPASKTAVEKANMLIGIRLSLYTFVGAYLGLRHFLVRPSASITLPVP